MNKEKIKHLPINKFNINAFTLVELIVVITILSILGSIAFFTLQGYSLQARDSTRISDISSMKTSLALFQLDSGKYPKPSNGVDITYSGGLVWNQGSFGENVRVNLDKLNKTPTDPLTDKEYTYSVLNTNNEYEIGTVMEGFDFVYSPKLQNNSYASNLNAYISGTYNGILAKVSTGSTLYILALPSIIASDTSNATLQSIITNESLSYNGTTNLPSTYKLYTQSGGFDFNSSTFGNLLVYEGSITDLSNSGGLQIDFIQNLQLAYSGVTDLNNIDISNILKADSINDPNGTQFLAQVLIQQTLNSSLIVNTSLSGTGTTSGTGATNTISKLSLGLTHSCLQTSGGGVKCWGRNNNGQLGDSTNTDRLTPVDVTGLTSGVSNISLGDNHSCAVLNTGGVKCWGSNGSGRLGDGTTIAKNYPVDVSGLTSGVSNITAGGAFTCVLTTGGGVKCWGLNTSGQLGDASNTQRLTAVDVSGLTSGVSNIYSGSSHACAITTSGGLKCWGNNANGQLGDNTQTNSNIPVSVTGLSTGVTNISLGTNHTCAVVSGGAKCWGINTNGQLGDNSTSTRLTPVNVSGLTSGVSTISAGAQNGCAITTSGGLKCWGYNDYNQLLANPNQNLVSVNITGLSTGVTNIAIGGGHICAYGTSGLSCWGRNDYGQLGDGTKTYSTYSTPISTTLGSIGTNLSLGGNHDCIVTTGGGVKCWGYNNYSQLGDGTTTNRYTPTDVVGLTSGVAKVSLGSNHTCILTTGGGVKCWGYNAQGQLGDSTNLNKTTPVNVTGLSSGVSFLELGNNHSCVITTSGGAKCWGLGDNGDLGDGGGVNRNYPVDVTGLTSGVTNISAGEAHTCAVVSGGAKCWGTNQYGRLGDGTTIQRNSPVDVSGMTVGVTSVHAGSNHSCLLTTGGGVKCFGYNGMGQLGDGTNTDRNTPVNVTGLTSGVSTLNGANNNNCVLTTSGGVKCFGTTVTDVTGLTSGVIELFTGGARYCALITGGTIKCWGNNNLGQILDGYDYYGLKTVTY